MGTRIGSKLRERRKECSITVVELAKRTGFSPSYISQVERGIANPSITALKKIADALSVPVGFFFEAEGVAATSSTNDRVLVARTERKKLGYPHQAIRYELLSPDLRRKMEFIWITAPPGSDTGHEPYAHDGEECGVVLQGKMELWVGEEVFIVNAGESVYFSSHLGHRWRNIGEEELQAIWVVTPPTF